MKLIKAGKTKDVYELENGNYLLKFKDNTSDGTTIAGLGHMSLNLTKYYFEKINAAGIFTHYIDSDIGNASMEVRPAAVFGKNGIEVICRLKAAGSFVRRYGDYCVDGRDLDYFVEISLKDDERGDPMISREALNLLGILSYEEYDDLVIRAKEAAKIIGGDLNAKKLDLYDIKFEFGRIDGKIALIDEFSWGIMRVYKDGRWLQPSDLVKYFK